MPPIVTISDPLDPRLGPYREIRERDLVRKDHFIAEGEVVLRVLARSTGFETTSLLIADKRIDHLKPLIETLPDHTAVYRVGQDVLDAVTGFHIHRGILGLGRRIVVETAADLLAKAGAEALILVLFGIANHDNLGGIFRNAAGFGAAAVILDPQCCDPLYRKAIRVSVGASLVVPFARVATGVDLLRLLDDHGFQSIALSPGGASSLAALRRSPRMAVLLGTEGPGLPRIILDRINSVAIPMASGFDSLNVATTSGIVLHHLSHCGRELENISGSAGY